MKKSTILIAAVALIVVFVGGISASDFIDKKAIAGAKPTSFDFEQMIQVSAAELASEPTSGNISMYAVDDFEMLQ